MGESTEIRLAELMAVLSRAVDMTNGVPLEQSLASATLAVRIAEAAGLTEPEARDAYYLTMLRTVGCTGDHDLGRLLLGADSGEWITHLPNGSPAAMLAAIARQVGRHRPPVARAGQVLRAFSGLRRVMGAMTIHCELGKKLAQRLGLGEGVARGLEQIFERWDGKGQPNRIKGEALQAAVCVAQVATDAQVMSRLGGPAAARAMVAARAGKGYAPRIAEGFLNGGEAILAEIPGTPTWEAALAAEPGPRPRLTAAAADLAIRTIGEHSDMKSGFFHGHSAGVAALASGAGRLLRLPAADVQALERAGHLHDLGRGAVLADVWEKQGPLTDDERERVRRHSYDTERILARADFLGPAFSLAAQDHERLDGSGYHRRLPPASLPVAVRALAAADVLRALLEPRPHRPAMKIDRAASELRAEAAAGRLDGEAVEAVLGAAGQETRPAARPAGLTDREIEVLRQVARGLTNKEIAATLDISVKTAGHHVEHIFAKIGVTTRAAAGLFAMQHDLLA